MSHEHEVGATSWRLKKQRYGLVGEVCPHCDEKIFPPREICPNCGDEAKELFTFSGRGEVYTYTTVTNINAKSELDRNYTLAIVKLEEGPLVTARLTDLNPETLLEIGQRVEVTTRIIDSGDENGIIKYGYAFRIPIENG